MKLKQELLFAPILLAVFFCASCKFNQQKRTSGVDFLQGKWFEDSVTNKAQLVTYQQHQFYFTCDSFYLQVTTFSKVNLQGGPCFDKNHWDEFAKGNYKMVKDTLKLEGNFVTKDYKYKADGTCYRNGKYIEDFLLEKRTDSIVIFKSLQTGLFQQLNLKQKGECTLQKTP